jgi:alpha-L-rhamnosidase
MGATTIWERWDGIKPNGSFQTPDMNSYNHYAYGAIGDWMYRNMAGINSDESAPGYKKIMISPKPGASITNAAGELNTPYGLLKSSWKIENGIFKLDVLVPANTSATVILPAAELKDGKEISNKSEIGSGAYHFECRIAQVAGK